MIAETHPREFQITDNLDLLLQVLPPSIQQAIASDGREQALLEIVMDLGRQPEARYTDGSFFLSEVLVTLEDLEFVTNRVGEFGKDNRAGIERTLHRISAMRNRVGKVIGLTCRIGRAVFGTIDIMRDEVLAGKSILILGRPGVGKTTKLREVARVLSEEATKRVIIVDTSNEIAGDGDVPHPAIGRSRRMQVPEPALQHAVMIEAVENHMPEVIIIDEIGTEQEAFAARTIAERGVQLVGTAHGNTLENLLMNPTLSDLIGGIQAVTLSDDEARRRGTQKTVLERKAPPTFDVVIEMIAKEKMAIHQDVAATIDNMLRGKAPRPEIRERTTDGDFTVLQTADDGYGPSFSGARDAFSPDYRRPDRVFSDNYPPAPTRRREEGRTAPFREAAPPVDSSAARFEEMTAPPAHDPSTPVTIRIYPYGVSRNRLEKAIANLRVPAALTRTWDNADVVLALKAHSRREPARLRDAISANKPTFVVKSNTQVQIESILREMFGLDRHDPATESAMREAEEAAERVTESGESVELMPQTASIRRLQHQLIQQYHLASSSVGAEPYRRIRISKA